MHVTPREIIGLLNRDIALLRESQVPSPLREQLDGALRAEVEALRSGVPDGRHLDRVGGLLEQRAMGSNRDARHLRTALRAARELLARAEAALRDAAEGRDLPLYRTHRAVYATPHLPKLNCNWIDHGLLAGRNPLTALDAEWLVARGVTHVLDLREPAEWAPPRFGQDALDALAGRIDRRHIPVVDMGPPTPAQFDEAVAFLTETLGEPDALVYVHCRAGAERTAAILVAFHARRNRMGYDEALRDLQSRRPLLCPLPNQEAATRRWLGRT